MKLVRFLSCFSIMVFMSLLGCDNKTNSPNDNSAVVFKANWDSVQFGKQVNAKVLQDGSLLVKSSGNNPTILFPSLTLKPEAHYILSVSLSSDVNGRSQIFYSTPDTDKASLLEERSKWAQVIMGENTLVFDFEGISMGNRMRFDPLERAGTVQIQTFEIREVK